MALSWPCALGQTGLGEGRDQRVAHGLVAQRAVDKSRDRLPTKHPSGGIFYCSFVLFYLLGVSQLRSRSTFVCWEQVNLGAVQLSFVGSPKELH